MAGMDDEAFILKYHEVALDRKEEYVRETLLNADVYDTYRGRRTTRK